jgi:two-component system, OmpR family, response regulator MprA
VCGPKPRHAAGRLPRGTASSDRSDQRDGRTFTRETAILVMLNTTLTAPEFPAVSHHPGRTAVPERILIVEDDERIASMLRRGLIFEGYDAAVAVSGRDALDQARDRMPDLLILDLMLPEIDGIEVCRRIRAASNVPILMLTAKDAVTDKVQGLDAGADDYLAKPFAFAELLARVRALLRRVKNDTPDVMHFEDIALDTGTRQARRGKRVIDLTAKEYDLLEMFMRHPRQVLTRDQIFDEVWGYDFGGESNIIEVYVRYLRTKLESGEESRLLHTVRGVGYVLREPTPA